MRFRLLLLSLFLLIHNAAFAWDSEHATTSIFQLFYLIIVILALVSVKWASRSRILKIIIIMLCLGFIFILFFLSALLAPTGNPAFFKSLAGFAIIIIFIAFYRKSR